MTRDRRMIVVFLASALLGCGPLVPAPPELESGEGSSGADAPTTTGPVATSDAPSEPGTVTTSEDPGDGFTTTGAPWGSSGSSGTWGSSGLDPAELCESVADEEYNCIAQVDGGWAVIGTDSGVVCEIGGVADPLAEDAAGFAWNGTKATYCIAGDDGHAIVHTDPQTGEILSSAHPCIQLLDWDDGLLVVELRPDGRPWAVFYPDLDAALAGAMTQELPIEPLSSRFGGGGGAIFGIAAAGGEVMLTTFGATSSVTSSFEIDRGLEPAHGIDRVDDALFILGDRTIERYDLATGALVSKTGFLGIDLPAEFLGLHCG